VCVLGTVCSAGNPDRRIVAQQAAVCRVHELNVPTPNDPPSYFGGGALPRAVGFGERSSGKWKTSAVQRVPARAPFTRTHPRSPVLARPGMAGMALSRLRVAQDIAEYISDQSTAPRLTPAMTAALAGFASLERGYVLARPATAPEAGKKPYEGAFHFRSTHQQRRRGGEAMQQGSVVTADTRVREVVVRRREEAAMAAQFLEEGQGGGFVESLVPVADVNACEPLGLIELAVDRPEPPMAAAASRPVVELPSVRHSSARSSPLLKMSPARQQRSLSPEEALRLLDAS